MKQYNIRGMSCAACSARVEKAVSAVPGVQSCSVSLLTNSMGVEGSAAPSDIIKAVENAGYGASEKGTEQKAQEEDRGFESEAAMLKKRLAASVILLIPLMYMSMGHMMWGFPLPDFLKDNHVAMGIAEMLLAGIIMVINQKFFISGFKGAVHRSPNMDTLVAMGAGVSFLWSVYILFGMTSAQLAGNTEVVELGMMNLYFESAAMILTLITVGKMLEARAKGRTTDALKSLIRLSPKTARIERGGNEIIVPSEQVKAGDIFLVKPGENIPADGVVIEGHSAVNESALSGESIPVDKAEGDGVSAGTINTSGFLRCEATRVGEDTTLSQIIKLVSDAAATKAPIAKIADRVSGVFVPAVIGIAAVTMIIWLVLGRTLGYALARAISVLVISCPCALGLATPVAIMVGSGVGARCGILFKTAVSLEETGKVKIIALDKTGTITSGEPAVTEVVTADADEFELLFAARALEQKSEHPLAKAIIKYTDEKNIAAKEVTDFEALPGNGLSAVLDGRRLYGGNLKFIEKKVKISDEILKRAGHLAQDGKTPLFFADEDKLLGIIAVADVIKEDSPAAVKELKALGLKVVMLTGDNESTAKAIGKQAGVDEVIAGVLPHEKENVIRKLQTRGKTAMVGDGINDAPALTRADTGLAIGAGTDVALDAADVVLMKSSLKDAVSAIRLSRATIRNIYQNLFWAFIYNLIGIPLAAGAFGWELSPMFGAAAMSLSSFCVVTNALRLNFVKLYDEKKNRREEAADKTEVNNMSENMKTYTFKIKGMMCAHCEATVKKCLEEFPEVEEAVVSSESATAVVRLTGDTARIDEMKKAIAGKGYEALE